MARILGVPYRGVNNTPTECPVLLRTGQPVVRHGAAGRKQKAIIRRESIMAAGQIGKVPGASPRNPTDARSREVKEEEKKNVKKYLKCSERRLGAKPDSRRGA